MFLKGTGILLIFSGGLIVTRGGALILDNDNSVTPTILVSILSFTVTLVYETVLSFIFITGFGELLYPYPPSSGRIFIDVTVASIEAVTTGSLNGLSTTILELPNLSEEVIVVLAIPPFVKVAIASAPFPSPTKVNFIFLGRSFGSVKSSTNVGGSILCILSPRIVAVPTSIVSIEPPPLR